MEQKKKKQAADLARDKNVFAGGSSAKGGRNTQKAKQKQPGAHQPRDGDVTSGHHVQKPDNDGTEKKVQSGFSKEQYALGEENGGEQAEETKDDYHRRDTYHRSEKKGRYRRREHRDRERTKTFDFGRDFQTKDSAFTERDSFTDGGEPEFQGSKKLDRMQKKAEKAGRKTEAARKKLPKTKEYSLERVFDEKTGRAKYVLTVSANDKM